MRKLSHASLIEPKCIVAQLPPDDLAVPLCCWRVGGPLPDAGKVSWAARKRYRSQQLKNMTAYLATEKTRIRLGGPQSPALKLHQASHDLAVAELFVIFARRWPRVATLWQGEDCFAVGRAVGEMVEDALLIRDRPLLGLEIGAYRADRFRRRFHDFASRQLPFRCY